MMRIVILVLRLLLGVVFVYAAYTKLKQPWLVFALSIDSYQILPAWTVFTVARTLPWIELAIGILLLIGVGLKYAAPAVMILLLGFYGAMLRAYATGASIDCGCFGIGEALTPKTLLRDGVLLACAAGLCFLVYRRRAATEPLVRSVPAA